MGRFETVDEARAAFDRSLVAAPVDRVSPRLEDYWKSLLEEGEDWEARYSSETCNLYDSVYAKAIFAKPLGLLRLSEISKLDTQRWVDRLYRDYKESSVRRFGSCLNRVLDHAKVEGYIAINPAEGLRFRKIPEVPAYILSEKEIIEMPADLAEINETLAAMLIVLSDTGCRPGELCGLLFEDITPEGIWVIAAARNKKGTRVDRTKTGRVRSVKLSEDALEAIRAQGVDRGPVFRNAKGKPITPDALGKMFRRWRSRAKISGAINARNLRKTFVTRAVESGDIKSAQAIVGHASAKTTLDIYAKARSDPQAALIEKLAPKRPAKVHREEDREEGPVSASLLEGS